MADYCTDAFKMVEDTDDSYRMWQGLVGPHYTPSVSNDGTLRWTNNGGLPNPSEVNLMGPQGAGIRIAGIRESAEELPATAPAGDIWLVGEGSPYEGYSFTGGEWLDLGPLTVGPAGPPGPQGDDYDLTEADKQEIAEISEGLLLAELDNDPLAIRYGGTGAHDLAGAKENLGISDIEDKMGTWPLGTDAQDVAGAINEMIGEISLQVADIEQLKADFAGEFSPTSTYAVGAYVVYGGAFWRCHTPVTTAGSWTGASNWEQVTAGTELEALATTIDTVGDKVDALAASDIANDSAVSGAKVSDALTGLKSNLSSHIVRLPTVAYDSDAYENVIKNVKSHMVSNNVDELLFSCIVSGSSLVTGYAGRWTGGNLIDGYLIVNSSLRYGFVIRLNSDTITLARSGVLHLSKTLTAGTGNQAFTVTGITDTMYLVNAVFGTPTNVLSNITWTTAANTITFNGTIGTGGTTVTFDLIEGKTS